MPKTIEKDKLTCDVERLLRLAISKTGFIFDPQTGQSFTVNHTGLMALELLRRGTSTEETASSLSVEFDVPYEVAASSVEAFLLQLGRYL